MPKTVKSNKTPMYRRTSQKIEYKGRKCTVYIRAKDGERCIRRKDKQGKSVYRKVTSLAASPKPSKRTKRVQGGGCGCAGTSPPVLSGGAWFGGDPGDDDQYGAAQKLEKNNKSDLYKKARKYGIKGRSKMTKPQLVLAVRSAQRAIGLKMRVRKRKSVVE